MSSNHDATTNRPSHQQSANRTVPTTPAPTQSILLEATRAPCHAEQVVGTTCCWNQLNLSLSLLYIYIYYISILSPDSIYIVSAQTPPPPLELGGPTDCVDVSLDWAHERGRCLV
jgi:hypothetical protein